MSDPSDSKEIFVGKVLGEVLSAVSDLQARVQVLTEEVIRLRVEQGDESVDEVRRELDRRVEEVEDSRLEEVSRRFTE